LSGAAKVIVATDDERIEAVVKAFGGEVRSTERAATCGSGSESLSERVELQWSCHLREW
jgi:3-deoxy-manno-octulosonate cytidylyltransferase (CMP-KDO synthetase)